MRKKDENGRKVRSLSSSLMFTTSIKLTLTLIILFSVFGTYTSIRNISDSAEQSLQYTVSATAQSVSNRINDISSNVSGLAAVSQVFEDNSKSNQKNFIDSSIGSYGFLDMFFIGKTGVCSANNMDYSNVSYFKSALSGETYIGEPQADGKSGQYGIPVAAPIWANGVEGTKTTGVLVCVVPLSAMQDIVDNTKVSDNSNAILLDSSGNTIAVNSSQSVPAGSSLTELHMNDQSAGMTKELFQKAQAGKTVVDKYDFNGKKSHFACAPVANTNGWVVCINAPTADFTGNVKYIELGFLIISIMSIAFAIWGTLLYSKKIMPSLHASVNALSSFAEGDFSTPLPELALDVDVKEFIDLYGYIETVRKSNNIVVADIDYLLCEMASGNFDVEFKVSDKYVGDYKDILDALCTIKTSLSSTLGEMLFISEQVASGSNQVSSGAQQLAQGSTEQASTIQELSASILEVKEIVNQNAEDSLQAKTLTDETSTTINESLIEMSRAMEAMDEISETSKNIGKVIKSIDDIAFQTNILALNAAVEAARAGEAGKGFAVVADEVRNLSQKSAEAAKDTTRLIENSMTAVEKGASLVGKVNSDFADVTQKAKSTNELIDQISTQAQQQAVAVNQISSAVDQVSSVVQQNSATSEESAAASVELSSQAATLKDLVERFKLSDTAQS